MAALHYELVTPERLERSGEAHMVVVPGSEGEFGVLVGHAPMMATVRDGEIAIFETENSAAVRFRISGGFAEVSEQGLTVLAEKLEPVTDGHGMKN